MAVVEFDLEEPRISMNPGHLLSQKLETLFSQFFSSQVQSDYTWEILFTGSGSEHKISRICPKAATAGVEMQIQRLERKSVMR